MTAAYLLDILRQAEELIATGRIHQAHILIYQVLNNQGANE